MNLSKAIDHSSDIVMITNRMGTIEYVNPAIEKITGYKSSEIIGKNPSFLKSGQHDNSFYDNLWNTINRGQTWQGMIVNRRKDGSNYREDTTISPIFSKENAITGFVAIKRDVTRVFELEKQLQQAQKMEAIGTMAGGIAHDFNNILTAILGYGEMVNDELPEASIVKEDMQKILDGGHRAAALVKQILTFSRQTDIKPRPIQPKIIVKETLKLLEASLPSTIEIRSNLQANEAVMADPTSIHQIIMNLCTNAGHAMRKNGGILDISLISVELDHDFARVHPEIRPGQFLRLTVSDTGHGMSHDVKERIFDPFFTTKGEGEGTGMGLSVVHGIVRSLDGAIVVYSEPDRGSSFSVYLPIHSRHQAKQEEPEEIIPGGKEHIVFVDDEEFIVDIAQQMLEMLGYRVVGKTDSREAFAYFKEHAGEIDLVITDFTMPHMTGIDLAREIRKIRPELPILLCTGYNTGFSEAELKEAGINAFILKPVVRKELAKVVRKVLDSRQ
jgi:PAS domain S-box-containing protein